MSTLPPLQDPPDWLYLVAQQVWARPEGDGTATVTYRSTIPAARATPAP